MSLRLANPMRALLPLVLLAFALSPINLLAQASPAASAGPTPSRVDLYAGYGYFHPFSSNINLIPYTTQNQGAVLSGAYYFSHHFGAQIEGNYFPEGANDNNCVQTIQGGPILRAQKGRFVPFFHALGGGAEVGGPAQQRCNVWGWGVTGGGGFDFILPAFHNRFAIRPIQADFSYSHINNGPPVPDPRFGGIGEIYAYRLSGGLTLRLGSMQGGVQPTLTCSADPGDPFPGDPVAITSSLLNLRPTKDTAYVWEAVGGKITPNGPAATIDTTNLNPGSYQVVGHLVHGPRKIQIASCTTSFTIRNLQPPSLSCSASRAAINSGDPVTITANAISPQSLPLTYSYTTTNGVVTGTGPTAALQTNGVTPGTITVTCNVADTRGQSATATASIVVATPPPPPPAPALQNLCSISFDRDTKRPDRVDNEAKGCLDDVALTLDRDVTAKLLMVGSHAAGESNNHAAARTMNAAEYLTREKGIDPARIELRIAPTPGRLVTNTLVPPGAQIDATICSSFDTSSVRRIGQPYGHTPVRTTSTPHKAVPHKRPVKRKKAPISAFTQPND